MVASIVALPALLSVVGTRIDALRVFPPPRPQGRAGRLLVPHGARGSCAGRSLVAVGVVAVLLFLGAPFLRRRVRHARRPRAAGVGAVARRQRAAPRRASAATPPRRSRSSSTASATADAGAVDDARRRRLGARRRRPRRRAGRHVRRRCPRRRRDGRGVGAVRGERRGPPRRRAGDRDRLAGGRGARSGTSAPSTPRSTSPSAARPPSSSTPRRRSPSRLPLALAIIVVSTAVLLFLLSGSVLVPIKALVLNAAQPDGDVRGDGVDLPGRQPVRVPRLHRHRARSTRRRRS